MSRFVLLIFVCAPLVVFSQYNNPTYKKLSLGISVEANYVERFLSQDRSFKYVPDITGTGKIGGAIGINLAYALTSIITLRTGLLFSDRGYGTKKAELIWASPDETYPKHSKTIFSSYFVDIPINVKYNFHFTDLDMYITGGPSIGQLIYRKTSVFTYFGNTREKTVSKKIGDGYMRSIFSFHSGVGFDVPISDKFSASIETLYRRTLTSLSHHHEYEPKRYFHSFGLNTHLSMRFKK